jgi:hypothetical protein
MAEYTLQPSPILRQSKQVYGSGVEGDWTPAFTFATPGDLATSYSFRVGRYIRLGDVVTVFFDVLCTAGNFTHSTASGALRITGLPVTSRDEVNANVRSVGAVR